MGKINVAFITGGYSGEAVVSYKSAETIVKNIDTELFNYYFIDIRKDGWWYRDSAGMEVAVNKNDFTITDGSNTITFDVAFVGIHGSPAEDGKLLGYFDMLGIKYTCCNAATSALTFNKRYTVAVADMAGVKVARSLHFYNDDIIDSADILNQLQLPLFIKPANGGSSIGMSKIIDGKDLDGAIAKAFKEDAQVLVEEFIEGREFTIGVAKLNGEIITLPITEIISKNFFFDYEAKYEGKSDEITPAQVGEDVAVKVRNAAKKLYKVFNCSGVIRIDFIYNEVVEEPYMLEINTIPGQSAASLIPQQVRHAGMELKDFYTSLIKEALN
ncbi:D-alanine--D-alanine ligase [Polluticaenibacter yanchengensis]|uniref:D-alanine--D-alanine ligase n=1 Tax=Polluticaenibacter yanchengensis TaxID=3014562 RepID=A0ABT4UHG2_9BACT|nr:D-alanine--D-alanine ligase [Chitinophagaceae bacterium LY-5]